MNDSRAEFQAVAKEFFQWELSKKKPQDVAMCVTILDEIIEKLTQHYMTDNNKGVRQCSRIMAQLSTRRQQQDERLFATLYEVLQKQLIRTIEHKGINIYHVKVHQQFVTNLCGYHASFNLLQLIQCAKYGQPPQIHDSASFWSHVCRTQSFLKHHAIHNDLDRSTWPWKDGDLKFGDFERTYWNTCVKYKPLFNKTFSDELYDDIKYTVRQTSIFFQYGTLVPIERNFDLDNIISELTQFKADSKNVMLVGCMLGITNHWLALLIQKSTRGVEFFFMDSRNRDYMEWSHQQMLDYLSTENQRRRDIDTGLTVWNQFYLDLHLQGMKDIQQCSRLVVELMTGLTTVDIFHCNSRLRVFLVPLVEFKATNHTQQELSEYVSMWADGYYETVRAYTRIPIKGMTVENKILFRDAMNRIYTCPNWQNDSKIRRVVDLLLTIEARL